MDTYDLKDFQGGYLECAAWSSTDTDEDGTVFDLDKFDYSRECEDTLKLQALEFFQKHYDLLVKATAIMSWSALGHDLWLTRNGHGAGFWDRNLPGPLGDDLTQAAHDAGSVDLYLNDNKEIDIL